MPFDSVGGPIFIAHRQFFLEGILGTVLVYIYYGNVCYLIVYAIFNIVVKNPFRNL